MTKIQFIVVGWHYNQSEFYNGLKELNDANENINVFWSCHKEPTDWVKENFDYKLFDNLGEEFIAFQQAIEYLNLDDDTVCFFIHDDIIIKNWEFINICVNGLNSYKFIFIRKILISYKKFNFKSLLLSTTISPIYK